MTKYCNRCNAKLPKENSKFCHECGSSQSATSNNISVGIGGSVENSDVTNAGRDIHIHKTGDEKLLRTCNVCKGEGWVLDWVTCDDCDGTGVITYKPHKDIEDEKIDHIAEMVFGNKTRYFAVGCKNCGGSGSQYIRLNRISDRPPATMKMKNTILRGRGKIKNKVICLYCKGQGVVKI